MNNNYFAAVPVIMAEFEKKNIEEKYRGISVNVEGEKESEHACLYLEKGYMPELIAYINQDGSFESPIKNFRNMYDLANSLNFNHTQLNELGEIIESSGWSQGDRDYVIAIDKKNDIELFYDESLDWYDVQACKHVKDIEKYSKKLEDLIKLSESEFVYSVEFWGADENNLDYHRDNLKGKLAMFGPSDIRDNDLNFDYRLMDEKEYNDTILCSASPKNKAKFMNWYGDPDARILVVLIY